MQRKGILKNARKDDKTGVILSVAEGSASWSEAELRRAYPNTGETETALALHCVEFILSEAKGSGLILRLRSGRQAVPDFVWKTS